MECLCYLQLLALSLLAQQPQRQIRCRPCHSAGATIVALTSADTTTGFELRLAIAVVLQRRRCIALPAAAVAPNQCKAAAYDGCCRSATVSGTCVVFVTGWVSLMFINCRHKETVCKGLRLTVVQCRQQNLHAHLH